MNNSQMTHEQLHKISKDIKEFMIHQMMNEPFTIRDICTIVAAANYNLFRLMGEEANLDVKDIAKLCHEILMTSNYETLETIKELEKENGTKNIIN